MRIDLPSIVSHFSSYDQKDLFLMIAHCYARLTLDYIV